MTDPVHGFAVGSGERPRLAAPAGEISVVIGTADSGGSMNVFEFWCPPGKGPRVHTHSREDEIWWVLEGSFRFLAGDEMLHAETGGVAFGPRGLPHAFQNVGSAAGRLLIVTAPGGIQPFFDGYAERWQDESAEALLADLASEVGLRFVGPPLSESHPD
ncbi:cupin domain-containing protein [Nocardioides panacisoli]|uniref:Cupin type-2 domain-containing protein n=1 Tax=Nocardioides panacisoli TaxID=627624 RepID=A0ABP7I7I9_9ACTN